MPAPKHKPNAIHKPTLSVALPIIIPVSNPIPGPKDTFDSFIFIKLVNSFNLILISLTYLRGLEVAELKEEDMPMV